MIIVDANWHCRSLFADYYEYKYKRLPNPSFINYSCDYCYIECNTLYLQLNLD